MGIGSITSMNGMSGMRMTTASTTDTKNKNIQNEITDVQQQMRALSSKEELSVSEKENERKTLRKKMASLNTELKQHQEEFRKSQKRETMMAELREDTGLAKDNPQEAGMQTDGTSLDKTAKQRLRTAQSQEEENKDAAISETGTKPSDWTMDADEKASRIEKAGTPLSDASMGQQNTLPGTVITKTKDGIVILKEDTKQEKLPGMENAKTADKSSLRPTAEQASSADKLSSEESKEADASEKMTKPSDQDTEMGLSQKEIHGIVSAEASVRQTDRQETVIARIEGGIAILKGEIKQDETRGVDTEQKQAELEKMEQREERARTFQSYVFGNENNAMKPAAKEGETQNGTQINTENNSFIRTFQFNQEAQAAQQRFYVSLDN